MLQLLHFGIDEAETIQSFDSHGAKAVQLGHGSGESHAYAVHLAAGGEIGFHEAGFGQLFVVVHGSGWVASPEEKIDVASGQAVFVERGTIHSKGSATGLLAIMIQVRDLEAVVA